MPAPATVGTIQPDRRAQPAQGAQPIQGAQPRRHIRISGRPAGRPMLFLQGFGSGSGTWRGVTAHFEADHLVVLVDQQVGDHPDLEVSGRVDDDALQRCAEDLLDLLRTLDLHDVVLVAHSVTAVIGALAADRDPSRISGLALTVPTPDAVALDAAGAITPADIHARLNSLDADYLDCSAALAPVGANGSSPPGPAWPTGEIRVFKKRPCPPALTGSLETLTDLIG